MKMSQKRRILIVDDEAVIALATAGKLATFGYTADVATDGESAVASALGSPGFDLILMDVDLGEGIDGTEAARRILSRREIPIVFLTAHSEEAYVGRVRQLTRYGYVIKNSGDFVLRSSIEMAFELFEANAKFRKKVAELEEKEKFLDRVLETIPLPIFVKDRKGTYIRVNRAFGEFVGKPSLDVEGRDVFEVYPPDLAKGYRERDEELMRQGGSQAYETKFLGVYGLRDVLSRKATYTDAEGRIAGLIGILEDITERKGTDEILARQRDEFETIFNLVPAQIWYKDTHNRFIRVNRRVCEDLGLRADEIEGRSADELFPAFGQQYYQDDLAVIRGARPKLGIIESITTASGEIRSLLTDKIPVFDAEGHVTGLIAFTQDVTERDRAQAETARLLAEKELILREVHHRIKNNMKTVESLLSLQAHSLGDPAARRALSDAGGRVRSMMVLYDKLYRTADFRSLSLADYLPVLVEEIVDNFPEGDSVRIDSRVEDITIDARRVSVVGMIVNELVTNIMKYAFTGRERGLIRITAVRKGEGSVVLTVGDDGVGFPETVDFASSTGFGLSLVAMLAVQLGGKAWMERGIGAAVSMEFPVAKQDGPGEFFGLAKLDTGTR